MRSIVAGLLVVLTAGCTKAAPDTSARLSDFVAQAEEVHAIADVKTIQNQWMAAIRALRARREIHVGMPVADLEAMLGPPTERGDDYVEWVFPSEEYVNPAFIASTEGAVVTGFSETAK